MDSADLKCNTEKDRSQVKHHTAGMVWVDWADLPDILQLMKGLEEEQP